MAESLSQDQVAVVLRRAAELDRELGSAFQPGLDPAAVEQAALEAGLSRPAVRRALAELQAGLLDAPEARHRGLLGPPTLSVTRTLPGPADEVERHLHRFLSDELFELRRHRGTRTTWVRRKGLEATARRAIDRAIQRRFVLRDVNHVDLCVIDHLVDDDHWALVRIDIDVLVARHLQGTLVGSATVLGGGLTLSTVGGLTHNPAFLALSLGGVGLAGAGAWAGSKLYRRRVADIESGVGGLLDRLERRALGARRFAS
jgi:hypothetical protein